MDPENLMVFLISSTVTQKQELYRKVKNRPKTLVRALGAWA